MAHTVCRPLTAALLLLAGGGAAAAYDATLGPDAIAEAIRIGQSRIERVRVDYHQPYRIDVGRAPVDYIDLVTPFRRVVLAAEERARQGDRRFGQREALGVLQEQRGRVTVFVELTFHPLNTYVGVPPYAVALAQAGSPERVTAIDTQRIPRFGPRLAGTPLPFPQTPVLPSAGQPVLGGTLVAGFDSGRLDAAGFYDIVIEESGKALTRTAVDLGKLR